jgi:FkbH-like protein
VSRAPELDWLPYPDDWDGALKTVAAEHGGKAFASLARLANHRIDLTQTVKLDRVLRRRFPDPPPLATKPLTLGVVGSSSLDHLLPGIRVGGLRRGLHISTITSEYGQYAPALMNRESDLCRARPDAVLFAFDARHLVGNLDPASNAETARAWVDGFCDRMVALWRIVRDELGSQVIQQSILPTQSRLFGQNEHRQPGAPAAVIAAFNRQVRQRSDEEGTAILAIDEWSSDDGVAAWHDPVYWHRAKQDVHPAAAPVYGDLVARLLAAWQGRSAKCLVLDLDNTLWSGVIGDDGLNGIVLGQGSALGEAHLAFQNYARALTRRGILLAVCSKNDLANAIEPFENHPDMVLKRDDVACFVANWQDKAHNLRQIAADLNIGLDALVFADDNPAERAIIRRELPTVAVPELPEDPALFGDTIARGGYFEAITLTAEDMARSEQYQKNIARRELLQSASDMDSYLHSLEMVARWSGFREGDIPRIAQLINKTNQFNLTTRRHTEVDVKGMIGDPRIVSLQIRLTDRYGDNGLIAVLIGRLIEGSATLEIDSWLMSCRVLGRDVESATLNLLADTARRSGADMLLGRYRPTPRNGMVADHYRRLGFAEAGADGDDTLWRLDLARFEPLPHHIDLIEG